MNITPEMITEDEKRWHARDVIMELGYCGNYMRDRKDMTNLDIRFYAYLMRKAHDMLKGQEKDYPICEKCGRQISNIQLRVVDYNGNDSVYPFPLSFDRETGCVLFETSRNWTGYELTDEEIKEDIRCPYCGKYPFDENEEVDFVEPVQVLMWTSYQTEQMRETPWEGENDA